MEYTTLDIIEGKRPLGVTAIVSRSGMFLATCLLFVDWTSKKPFFFNSAREGNNCAKRIYWILVIRITLPNTFFTAKECIFIRSNADHKSRIILIMKFSSKWIFWNERWKQVPSLRLECGHIVKEQELSPCSVNFRNQPSQVNADKSNRDD